MGPILQDLRDAWRSVRTRPAASLGIVLILGLGIGPSISVSAMVDRILLRRLQVENPNSLVKIYFASIRGGSEYWTTSYPIYRDYAEQSRCFRGLGIYREALPVDVSGGPLGVEHARAAVVSGSVFNVLAVAAERGRAILPEDNRSGAAPVVLISHAFWQERFGGDENVVGQDATINGTVFRVIGVAPKGFQGLDLRFPVDLWAPFSRTVEIYPPFRGQIDFRRDRVGRAASVHRARDASRGARR